MSLSQIIRRAHNFLMRGSLIASVMLMAAGTARAGTDPVAFAVPNAVPTTVACLINPINGHDDPKMPHKCFAMTGRLQSNFWRNFTAVVDKPAREDVKAIFDIDHGIVTTDEAASWQVLPDATLHALKRCYAMVDRAQDTGKLPTPLCP